LTLPSAKESYNRLAGKDSFGAEQDSARRMGAVLPDGVITEIIFEFTSFYTAGFDMRTGLTNREIRHVYSHQL
jgi:hypothetical protein